MAPAAATRTRAGLVAAIQAEIAVFLQSVSGGVRAINDGPCAAFTGAVHARLSADPRILIIRTADYRASGCFGSPRIKSKRVKQISPASKPPAPLSWGDLDTLGIIQDAHCWLMFQGRLASCAVSRTGSGRFSTRPGGGAPSKWTTRCGRGPLRVA